MLVSFTARAPTPCTAPSIQFVPIKWLFLFLFEPFIFGPFPEERGLAWNGSRTKHGVQCLWRPGDPGAEGKIQRALGGCEEVSGRTCCMLSILFLGALVDIRWHHHTQVKEGGCLWASPTKSVRVASKTLIIHGGSLRLVTVLARADVSSLERHRFIIKYLYCIHIYVLFSRRNTISTNTAYLFLRNSNLL